MDEQTEKRRPITDAQWLAARAASEGAPLTRSRLAATLGCDVTVVYRRAALEGWKRPDFRRPAAQASWGDFMDAVYGVDAGPDASVGAGAGEAAMDHEAGLTGAGDDAGWADDPDVVEKAIAGRIEADDGEAVFADKAGIGAGIGADGGNADADGDPVALLARGTQLMSRQLSALIARGERGGRLHKAEIDGLVAMARMMERWETLAAERAKEEEVDSDAKIAEALRRIDGRILKLAREEAERLVAEEYRPAGGGPDR